VRAHSITIAAVLAAATPAAYGDNALRPERIPNKARDLAMKGRKHHDAGDYASAVAAFKEAYVLAPSPGLLFNIAQSYRLGGNCDEAAWMYRRFLDTNPHGVQRDLAETHLAAVEKCGTGGLRITVPPSVEAVASAPESAERADARASRESRDSLSITSKRGSSRNRKLKRAGTYTLIGGGVALVGAAVFAFDANSAAQAVEETYERGGKWSDLAADDARGKRSSAIATTLGIGGGLAVVTGAVLYGLGRHYEQARYVAVTPTQRGAQVSLSWGF
jgi:hypothetical protein